MTSTALNVDLLLIQGRKCAMAWARAHTELEDAQSGQSVCDDIWAAASAGESQIEGVRCTLAGCDPQVFCAVCGWSHLISTHAPFTACSECGVTGRSLDVAGPVVRIRVGLTTVAAALLGLAFCADCLERMRAESR